MRVFWMAHIIVLKKQCVHCILNGLISEIILYCRQAPRVRDGSGILFLIQPLECRKVYRKRYSGPPDRHVPGFDWMNQTSMVVTPKMKGVV